MKPSITAALLGAALSGLHEPPRKGETPTEQMMREFGGKLPVDLRRAMTPQPGRGPQKRKNKEQRASRRKNRG